jgi:glycosyltransferase involved in cell wall biosynthesis
MIVPTGVRYVSVPPGTGYGDSANQYVSGLRARGVPVKREFADYGGDPSSVDPGRTNDVAYDTVLVHLRPQDFHRWVEPGSGRLHVAYTVWETDRVPDFWRSALEPFDLVLVPSAFNRRSIIETGINTRAEVLPHIARRVEPVGGGSFGDITDDDFVFYTMGPWHNRKALPETIRAYLDTFTARDQVALIIKTSAFDYGAVTDAQLGRPRPGGAPATTSWWSLAKLLAEHSHPPKVYLHRGQASPREIDQIHTRADCFVSLARGEGWGLGSFDGALFGNPPILPGWGGPLEWLPSDYPFLVDYELVPTSADAPDAFGYPLSADARWAQADAAHAGRLMRQAYENREQTAALGAAVRATLVDRYSSVVITSRLIELIARAHDRRSVR